MVAVAFMPRLRESAQIAPVAERRLTFAGAGTGLIFPAGSRTTGLSSRGVPARLPTRFWIR